MRSKRYGPDVLAAGNQRQRRELRRVPAEPGLVVEDATGRFCGAVVLCEKDAVTLEDRHGNRRVFPLGPAAFLLEGEPVMLVRPAVAAGPAPRDGGLPGAPPPARWPPRPAGPRSPGRAASTSRAATTQNWWRRSGETTCATSAWSWSISAASTTCPRSWTGSAPAPGAGSASWWTTWWTGRRRAGSPPPCNTRMCSSSAIPTSTSGRRSSRRCLASAAGRGVPPGTPWKEGVLQALGWPPDTAAAWQRILHAVTSYADLEPEFLGRVEELIDFVTAQGSH